MTNENEKDLQRVAELEVARGEFGRTDPAGEPRLTFRDIAPHLPLKRPRPLFRRPAFALAAIAAAAAVLLLLLPPRENDGGVKGTVLPCGDVRLRLESKDREVLLRSISKETCWLSLHAVDLEQKQVRLLQESRELPAGEHPSDPITLKPGRWALVLTAAPSRMDLDRDRLFEILRAIGEGRDPPLAVDIYRLEVE